MIKIYLFSNFRNINILTYNNNITVLKKMKYLYTIYKNKYLLFIPYQILKNKIFPLNNIYNSKYTSS